MKLMPQAVPAILIAAAGTAGVALGSQILVTFVINVALSGFEFDENGDRWVALKRK